MSTIKAINVQHPSSATTNLVNDSSGNVTAGANLTVTGTSTLTGNVLVGTITGSGRITSKTTTTDNTTYPLYMQNSAGSVVGFFRSDGNFNTGALSNAPYNNTTTAAPNLYVSSSGDVLRSTAVVGGITQGTAVASTSGTSIDFTSIPSTAKRVTVMFNGVSTNGSSLPMIQLGDSGGIETTGYNGDSAQIHTGASGSAISTGFNIYTNASTNVLYGQAIISYFGSNTWICSFVGGTTGNPLVLVTGGAKTLSDVLDRVRITTVNGTDTFDAGSINILYE